MAKKKEPIIELNDIHQFAAALRDFCQRNDIEFTGGQVESELLDTGRVFERQAHKLGCERKLTMQLYAFDQMVDVMIPELPLNKPTSREGVKKIRALDTIQFIDDFDDIDEVEDGSDVAASFSTFPTAYDHFVKLAKLEKKKARQDNTAYQGQLGSAEIEVIRWHVDADSRMGILRMGEHAVPLVRVDHDWTIIDPAQMLTALGNIRLPDFGSSADVENATSKIADMALRYNMELIATGDFSAEVGFVDRRTMRFKLADRSDIYFTINTETLY